MKINSSFGEGRFILEICILPSKQGTPAIHQGIASRDEENGAISFGRHATSIKMGRDMWETPELTSVEKRNAQETFFGGSAWPKTNDMSQPWPEIDVATKAARETSQEMVA